MEEKKKKKQDGNRKITQVPRKKYEYQGRTKEGKKRNTMVLVPAVCYYRPSVAYVRYRLQQQDAR